MKEDAEATKECFEAEKAHWIDEKEKVIRYQKQLQLNYVQVRNIPIPYYSIKTSYIETSQFSYLDENDDLKRTILFFISDV